MIKFRNIIFIIAIVGFGISAYLHKDTTIIKGEKAFYVGSDSCKQCHTNKHKGWHNSSHRKIYKRYTDESQIIADFENKPDFVKFDKEDIDVIIGYQWEQVFAREIDGVMYPFPAKWMNLTKQWIPYKTKNWHKTPLTQKCDGCHTTGLNIETGEFKEYGVGCESCHGPGSKHVQNKSMLQNLECNICHNDNSLKEKLDKEVDIVRSGKSAICGQCHSRGTQNKVMTHQTEVQFNFPTEYLPGQTLSKYFEQTTLQTDKKGKNWWGNGISKNRHQEYADFARSGHSKSLKNLRTKRRESCGEEPNDNCLKCHSGDYIMAKRYNDKVSKQKQMPLPTINNAQDDITCVVCHNPHKVGDKKVKAADMCVECHTKDTKTMKEDKEDHYPCPTKEVTCADCHMPKIVKTGGKFSLRSHAFKIIPPEATIKYGMPNSCQNGACHADKSTQWAIDEYTKFYKNSKLKKTLADEIKGMK
ncbi:MAG: multiheme c-type cytochrome [Patescibacteria group bacterium]|nr:multiheme c-type cytochrome [Patescibacteria group bacterium]